MVPEPLAKGQFVVIAGHKIVRDVKRGKRAAQSLIERINLVAPSRRVMWPATSLRLSRFSGRLRRTTLVPSERIVRGRSLF